MDELKKIFDEPTPVSNDRLKEYLKENTSETQKHEIELSFDEDDPFMNEAVEGLVMSNKNIDITLYEIESKIHQKLKTKKNKSKKKIKDYNSVLIATIFLLFLSIISFIIIKLLLKK